MPLEPASRLSNWKWYVCGMLLLALVLNYMDRQTLSLTITAIEQEIHTNNTQYGRLEKGFGFAFAVGSLFFGLLADRLSVKWLYPLVLVGWSAAGLATGFADRMGGWVLPLVAPWCDVDKLTLTSDPEVSRAYLGFLVCRITLGFFEAGQWPCALVTTQRMLAASDRPFGNSILQSGASIGAILTPLVVGLFAPPILATDITAAAATNVATATSIVTSAISASSWTTAAATVATTAAAALADHVGWWRSPYVVIGCLGILWIGPWLWLVRGMNLSRPAAEITTNETAAASRGSALWNRRLSVARRFLALAVVVVVINMTWQYFRVWLPKMLEQFYGYRPNQVRWFVTAYYIATDVGCIAAGWSVKWLAARDWNVHRARMVTFSICAALTALSTVASQLAAGPLLLVVFLVIGFGALGLFPNYYSFTQELSGRHQGIIGGSLGFLTWVVTSDMQERVGKVIDNTHSYTQTTFYIGLLPLLGCAALWLLWGRATPDTARQKAIT